MSKYFAALLTIAALCAQQNPYSTPPGIEEGRKLYIGRCGHCHGQEGEGGRGAVLNSGRFRHGGTDAEIFAVIRRGIPNSEMPGAPRMPEPDVWRITAFVKQLGRQGTAELVAGDPAAGAALYKKHACAQCHTIAGQGGHLGPDLSPVGSSRAARHLRESLVSPAADLPIEFRTAVVTTSAGQTVRGIHLNEDEYSIHLRDANGDLRSFLKAEVKDLRIPRESLMPAYNSLSQSDLDNLVAYLASLRLE